MEMDKQLHRSRRERMIFGVCGGLAEYFDVDPVFIRVVFVALAFLQGIGILAYIILALVMPEEGREPRKTTDVGEQKLSDTGEPASTLGEDYRGYADERERVQRRNRGRNLLALTLILIGILFLIGNLGFLWWVNLNIVWPLILVVIGLLLIFGRTRR